MNPCFVCDAPLDLATERPKKWVIARSACSHHWRSARFPTGEPVIAFLGRRTQGQHPLEGSGLNFILNPVDVGGHRAWLDFHFEFPSLWEEVFPSDSYFQYLVQHRSTFVEVLFAIHRESRTRGKLLDGRHLFKALPESNLQDFFLMLDLWEFQWHVDIRLRDAGGRFPHSPDEARSRIPDDSPLRAPADDSEAFSQLEMMAKARFAHFGG